MQNDFNLKFLIIIFSLSITFVGYKFFYEKSQSQSKVIFCNVGQGDGAYIRSENKYDILVDAGPDKSILNCLGKYMPFYDRQIEAVFLSHPQKDHYGGLTFILDRYKILKIIISPIDNEASSFQKLLSKIKEKNISTSLGLAGETYLVGNSKIQILSPLKSMIEKETYQEKNFFSLRKTSKDPNYFSIIMNYEENGTNVLFTGDAPGNLLDKISRLDKIKSDILKVPHHGSKNGLTKNFLRAADPFMAVISVGKNSYGHPSKSILDLLTEEKVQIRRTDMEGNIIIKIKN